MLDLAVRRRKNIIHAFTKNEYDIWHKTKCTTVFWCYLSRKINFPRTASPEVKWLAAGIPGKCRRDGVGLRCCCCCCRDCCRGCSRWWGDNGLWGEDESERWNWAEDGGALESSFLFLLLMASDVVDACTSITAAPATAEAGGAEEPRHEDAGVRADGRPAALLSRL